MTLRLRADDVVWEDLDGSVVALDLRASAYFTLNGSGTVLWRRVVEGTTRDELARALVDRYGLAVDHARVEVDDFLAALAGRGLLEGSG